MRIDVLLSKMHLCSVVVELWTRALLLLLLIGRQQSCSSSGIVAGPWLMLAGPGKRHHVHHRASPTGIRARATASKMSAVAKTVQFLPPASSNRTQVAYLHLCVLRYHFEILQ